MICQVGSAQVQPAPARLAALAAERPLAPWYVASTAYPQYHLGLELLVGVSRLQFFVNDMNAAAHLLNTVSAGWAREPKLLVMDRRAEVGAEYDGAGLVRLFRRNGAFAMPADFFKGYEPLGCRTTVSA